MGCNCPYAIVVVEMEPVRRLSRRVASFGVQRRRDAQDRPQQHIAETLRQSGMILNQEDQVFRPED